MEIDENTLNSISDDKNTWDVLVFSDAEDIQKHVKQELGLEKILNRKIRINCSSDKDIDLDYLKKCAVIFLDCKVLECDKKLFEKFFCGLSARIIAVDSILEQKDILMYDICDVITRDELLKMDLKFKINFILKRFIQTRDFGENQQKLRDISDSYKLKVKAVNESNTGIAISDQKGCITWINTSFTDITGILEEKVLGNVWERVLLENKVSKAFGKNDYNFYCCNGVYKTAEVIYKDGIDKSVIVLRDITERVEKRKQLYRDIEMARKIQSSVLPVNINSDNVKIKGIHKPVERLGGDMYYFERLSDNRYGIVLLDVMGHGIATSLITMYIRSLLSDIFKTHKTPAEIANTLQDVQFDFNETFKDEINYYFTSIIAIIDLNINELKYVNAGHPSAIVTYTDGSSDILRSNLIPIGLWKNKNIEDATITTENMSNLLLYTDGFSESKAINFESMYSETIDDIDNVDESFEKWFKIIAEEEFHDDVSMVWMNIKK